MMGSLVIVDTTAAPALYFLGHSSFGFCVALWNIPIRIEGFHT